MNISSNAILLLLAIVLLVLYTADIVLNGTRVPIKSKTTLLSGILTSTVALGFCILQIYAWRPGKTVWLLSFFTIFVIGCCTIIVQFFDKRK